MLKHLSVKGAIVIADAMHCQTKTAEIIRTEAADYMLQVKDDQRNLHQEIVAFSHKAYRDTPQALEDRHYEKIDKSHSHINYRQSPITDWLSGIE